MLLINSEGQFRTGISQSVPNRALNLAQKPSDRWRKSGMHYPAHIQRQDYRLGARWGYNKHTRYCKTYLRQFSDLPRSSSGFHDAPGVLLSHSVFPSVTFPLHPELSRDTWI